MKTIWLFLAFAGLMGLGVNAQAQVQNCGRATLADAGAGICCGSGYCVALCLADGGGFCGGAGSVTTLVLSDLFTTTFGYVSIGLTPTGDGGEHRPATRSS